MKTTIISILLCLSMGVVGQSKDTIVLYDDGYSMYIGSTISMGGLSTYYNKKIEISIDTLPVLMLIADTFYGMKPTGMMIFESDSSGMIKVKPDSSYRKQLADVWYINGYEVRRNEYRYKDVSVDPNYQMADGSWTLLGRVHSYEKYIYRSNHVEYLNSQKKPLPKNIVVWMTK